MMTLYDEMPLHTYKIGLMLGGLPEDPEHHVEFVAEVKARNMKDAKDFWATKTKNDDRKYWDPVSQTYWGWNVIILAIDGISI